MAQTQFFRDVKTVRHRENASRCLDALSGDDHRTIMQGGILKEDVLNKSLIDIGVYFVACV